MPQELHVLRCFSCETFQVQIVKKSNRWECKMCGEKQSVKQVYGRGSGKDCRAHVQKLNELRLKKEQFIDPYLENCGYQNNECYFQSVDLEDGSVATKLCRQTPKLSNENDEPSYPKKRNSKWSEFLASSSSASGDDDGDAIDQSHFKPHSGDNSRKTIKKQKIASRHEEQFKLENMSKEPTTYWRAIEGNVNSFLDVGVKNTNVFGDLGNVPYDISNSIRSKSLETCQHNDIGKVEKFSSAVSDQKGPFNLGPLYSSQAEIGRESGNSANDMIMHRTIDLKDGEERSCYVATNCHQKTTVNAQPYIFDYNEEELDDIFNI